MFSLLWINSEHTVNRVSVSQDRRQKQFWWKQYCIYFHSTGVEAHRKHSILSFRWGMGEVLHASSSEYLPLSQCRPFSRPLRHEEVLQRQTVGSDDPLAKTVRTGRIDRDRHGSKVNPGSALSLCCDCWPHDSITDLSSCEIVTTVNLLQRCETERGTQWKSLSSSHNVTWDSAWMHFSVLSRYVWMLGSMLKGRLRMCPSPSFLLCVVLHGLPKIRPDGGKEQMSDLN